MRLQISIAAMITLWFAPLSFSEPPTHGTINILLANGSGIVLVTDSRASDDQGRKVNDSSQKLFQIDPQTVCSIAGFGADAGPHRAIKETAGGVIASFTSGIGASQAKLSFRQKVFSLTGQLSTRLAALETEYEFAEKSVPPRLPSQDQLILLFAGFDLDGVAMIAKVNISVARIERANLKPAFQGQIEIVKLDRVGDDFAFLTSGVDGSAQSRLKSPKAFDDEKELGDYIQAVRDGHTAALTLEQLERLAIYLEFDASRTAGVVGGPAQIATLTKGEVHLKLPDGLTSTPEAYTTGIMVNVGIKGSPTIPLIQIMPHTVLVDVHCKDSALKLDGLILIGGDFEKCNFYFDGDDFYRDPTVRVEGGTLILGPHVPVNSYFFEKAHRSMPELAPLSYNDLPNAEVIRKQIWGNH